MEAKLSNLEAKLSNLEAKLRDLQIKLQRHRSACQFFSNSPQTPKHNIQIQPFIQHMDIINEAYLASNEPTTPKSQPPGPVTCDVSLDVEIYILRLQTHKPPCFQPLYNILNTYQASKTHFTTSKPNRQNVKLNPFSKQTHFHIFTL